jgi:hypothetical protein
MANSKIAIRRFVLFLAFEIQKSTFGNSDISREHAKAFGVPAGA